MSEEHQHPPFFERRVLQGDSGGGGYAKGLGSVLPELRSCVLLGGLAEGGVVKNIMILLSAETLAAETPVGGICAAPVPSFLGWI